MNDLGRLARLFSRSAIALVAVSTLLLGTGAVADAAQAGGLDLTDPTPRTVFVRFENSGASKPGGLKHSFDAPVKAWFSPGPAPGQAQVRIRGAQMEQVITNYEPVPGSFTDFVWTFDVESGHVVKAVLDGVVTSKVDWGLFESEVETAISMDLNTQREAGYMPAVERFGHTVFEFCEQASAPCERVPPAALDASGYVNAVGPVTATAIGGLWTQSFSPMGEVMIEESEAIPTVSAGP